jgi:hypothetical protein
MAAPASVHADLDPVIPQYLGELLAGELRALIGIEDAGLAEPLNKLKLELPAQPPRDQHEQHLIPARPLTAHAQPLGRRCGYVFRRDLFASRPMDAQKVIDDPHRKIGQLQVECDFLAGQPAISRMLRGGR